VRRNGGCVGIKCRTFETTQTKPEAIAFVLGHGETLVAHWFAHGNALVKFERAVEPRPPGTDATGSLEVIELDPDVPAVWWMFEDVAAVIRMRDYLDLVARGLVEAAGSEEPPKSR